jgi:4-hydroxybenzoate polyprenyltransferase
VEHAIESESKPLPITQRVMVAMGDIKLAHSVFAMPFAILGAFLVAPYLGDAPEHGIDWSKFAGMLVLIVVCMVLARNWAMLVNRVADAKIDAANPRTAKRAFASGTLSKRDGHLLLAFNAIAFLIACSMFGFLFGNWWPSVLGIPVLIWIGFYSFTKRFTWLCHLFLGGALAASPIAAAIAVGPENIAYTPAVFPIAAMVMCWVAGFDIIYALQDLDYDQEVGLSSIPSRFGWKRAAWLSRVLHVLALGALIVALNLEPRFGVLFGVAIGLVGVILIYEHVILARRGKAGIPIAFFTLNGIVSIVLGLAGVLDLLV